MLRPAVVVVAKAKRGKGPRTKKQAAALRRRREEEALNAKAGLAWR